MKVCWFGIYDPGYSRNKIFIDGLRGNDVTVVECNNRDTGIKKYWALCKALRALRNEYDVLYCAFPVHATIFLAYFCQKRPIVADAFYSKYDNVVHDRGTHSRWHPYAWFCYLLDYALVHLTDLLVVDTKEHQAYWSARSTRVSVLVVPVGVHTAEFFPQVAKRVSNQFLVQFHGSYIPLQGVENIVAAIELLCPDSRFRFRFIGEGQLYETVYKTAQKKHLPIEFLPWQPIVKLNELLNEADLILGIFGTIAKTDRVIPNKLYQGLAVKKPVLTKQTPATAEQFSTEHLFFCSAAPDDIASAICAIYDQPIERKRRAEQGYKAVCEALSEIEVGKRLQMALSTISVQ